MTCSARSRGSCSPSWSSCASSWSARRSAAWRPAASRPRRPRTWAARSCGSRRRSATSASASASPPKTSISTSARSAACSDPQPKEPARGDENTQGQVLHRRRRRDGALARLRPDDARDGRGGGAQRHPRRRPARLRCGRDARLPGRRFGLRSSRRARPRDPAEPRHGRGRPRLVDRVAHSKHASQNPKAVQKERVTVQDVVGSRWIVKPLHLLDCCLETDNATCLIVTSAERARDLRARPIYIMGVAGRVSKPRVDFHWAHGPISRVAGYYAKDIVFGQAGIRPEDVNVTGSYDAFTFTTMLQLEEYGFCKKGEGGAYVSSGIIELGGKRPNNTSGSHLCEGYTHGMSMVIENVRQLRGTVDDYCPRAAEGVHTYDYSPGHCRQVKDAEITMNLGWAMPATGSALIMRR